VNLEALVSSLNVRIKPPRFTHSQLLEMLSYDPRTGLFKWKKRPALPNNGGRVESWNTRFAGQIAGAEQDRYWRIRIGGRSYLAHRVAWFYVQGEWPANEIDHINHNKIDNRLENLRAVSPLENQRNRPAQRNSTGAVTGVHRATDCDRWLATIKIRSTNTHLGLFSDWFDAVCARKSAESAHGFHLNHGAIS
jgi:hypothetical protein